MRTIYKYPVQDGEIIVRSGALPVLCEMQNGIPYIWMEIETNSVLVKREFKIFGTGHEIPYEYKHIGSFQQVPFVWHLYEKENG